MGWKEILLDLEERGRNTLKNIEDEDTLRITSIIESSNLLKWKNTFLFPSDSLKKKIDLEIDFQSLAKLLELFSSNK